MGVTRKTNILLNIILVVICKQVASAKIYNNIFETRCGEEVLKSISNFRCCGNQLYNPDSQHCYQGVEIIELVEGKIPCGDELYVDNGMTVCCNETLYKAYEYTCCRNVAYKIEPNILCCGDKLFNYHPESYDTLLLGSATRGKVSCCGKNLYHHDNETCCQGIVHPVTRGICCGTKILDHNTETRCKDGTSFPIKRQKQLCFVGNIRPALALCKLLKDNMILDKLQNRWICCNSSDTTVSPTIAETGE